MSRDRASLAQEMHERRARMDEAQGYLDREKTGPRLSYGLTPSERRAYQAIVEHEGREIIKLRAQWKDAPAPPKVVKGRIAR